MEDFEEKYERGMKTNPPPLPDIAARRLLEMVEPMAKSKRVKDGMATLTMKEENADWIIQIVAGIGAFYLENLNRNTPTVKQYGDKLAQLFGLDNQDSAELRMIARVFRQTPIRQFFEVQFPGGELKRGDRAALIRKAEEQFPDTSEDQLKAAFEDWQQNGF